MIIYLDTLRSAEHLRISPEVGGWDLQLHGTTNPLLFELSLKLGGPVLRLQI